jgi:hypothetical protein
MTTPDTKLDTAKLREAARLLPEAFHGRNGDETIKRFGVEMAEALVACADEIDRLRAENEGLRRAWWLSHCPTTRTLYGEMQCSGSLESPSFAFADFRRQGPDALRAHSVQHATAEADRLRAEVETYREAGRALVTKLDAVSEAVGGVFTIALIHGLVYDGPNYGAERDAMRALTGPALDPQPTGEDG